jgi:hypothetical protein
MNTILHEMDKYRESMIKNQTTYYQSWVKTQKSKEDIEKAIEKIEKGGKNNDLMKDNDHSLKLAMIT